METILHLSDLHFGWEGDAASGLADRKVCLDGLLSELKVLDTKWKPSIICITGDIAWKGTAKDYEVAKKWLDELLEVCGLTYEQMVICPGNHDIIRAKAKRLPRPESTNNADEVLEVPLASHFEDQFSDYNAFYKETGMPLLEFGDHESCLVGGRTINGMRFVVLNSAWFSKDNSDKGKLWLGLPHVKYMESKGALGLVEDNPGCSLTYVLFHHPSEMLSTDEQHTTNNSRVNVLDYVAHRSHIMLTGHMHDAVRKPNRIAEQALHFTGGSTYAGASYFNSFRLIQIHENTVSDRAFEFDPRSAKNEWKALPADSRPLSSKAVVEQDSSTDKAVMDTSEFRVSFREHANRHRELKSRLLRQTGVLPATIDRPVSMRVSDQHDRFDSNGRLIRGKNTEHQLPFYQAVRESRRTLLFGDLGMGKSTLAAQLVTETMERSQQAVAILVVAKSISLPEMLTQRDLIEAVDKFIANEIWLKTPVFELQEVLEQGIEVTLVFDGLDELSRDVASRLLNQAAALVEHWPTIQVVCTARPVELVGTSYADWQVIHTVSLDDVAKDEFIEQELIADGVSAEKLPEKKSALIATLKEMQSLDSIASSPLAIRLIYQRLKILGEGEVLTLGNLLYSLLLERLGGWQKRDDKPQAFSSFDTVFPSPEQKALILSELAEKAVENRTVTIGEAKTLLEGVAGKTTKENLPQLADEAISFFEWLGLLSKSELVEFTLQPLLEVCAAVGLMEQVISGSVGAGEVGRDRWRVVSFMAAIARQLGRLNRIRDFLSAYAAKLLNEREFLPAACYIVTEADDCTLAEDVVKRFSDVGFRPLTWFSEEQEVSTRNVAKTLVLAGDIGFDWFYEAYLNPRYPITNAGSGIVGGIFTEWAALMRTSLKVDQKERLSAMVQPYQAAGEGHLHGALTSLSTLVPYSFSDDDQLWYQAKALDSRVFHSWAEQQLQLRKEKGDADEPLNSLMRHQASGSLKAARIWLDWNPGVEPPVKIVNLAMQHVSKEPLEGDGKYVADQCRQRLGEKRWIWFARWFLAIGGDGVLPGAVKVLYDDGERRLPYLGSACLEVLHNRGNIASVETILSKLVGQEGTDGVYWLTNKINQLAERRRCYPAWWRVLLAHIEVAENGAGCLAACCGLLDGYTLPRQPEVREAFARVLNGSNGHQFKETLRKQLKSLSPFVRRGASAILVSSDPRGEPEALFVSIRTRAGDRYDHDWSEWEGFCLSLDFSPSVLGYLNGKLELLNPHSRALALVILANGGFDISDYRTELLNSITDLGNWHIRREDACGKIIREESAFLELMQQLEKSGFKRNAASILLEFHGDRIDSKTKARCIAIRNDEYPQFWELIPQSKKIMTDPIFAEDLRNYGLQSREQGESPPILCLIALALNGEVDWKDVVWAMLCSDKGGSEHDENGLGLLELGFIAEGHRKSIGKAAGECLDDPRINNRTRWHDAYQWLGVLADEFDGLGPDKLRAIILHGRPIYYSAVTALIARLGEVPDGFVRKQPTRQRPTLTSTPFEKPDEKQVYDQLLDYSRDADDIHPSLSTALQKCLYLPEYSESALSAISAQGKPGMLARTILRFVYGFEPRLEQVVPLLDLSAQFWGERNSRFEIYSKAWNINRDTIIFEGGAGAKSYLKALDDALLDSDIWKLALAFEILELCGELTEAQIPLVFRDFSNHPTGFHQALFSQLSNWLSGDLTDEISGAAVAAAENSILQLNEHYWEISDEHQHNTLAYLIFPAILWALGRRTSDAANAVFLRGIQAIFYKQPNVHESPKTDLTKLVSKLGGLFAKAPPEILRNVIQLGVDSHEPSISSFCHLIRSFGRMVE